MPNPTPAGDEATPTPKGTEGESTPKNPAEGAELPPEVDYKKKFSESTRENQRVQAELAKAQADKAELARRQTELEAKLAKANETLSDESLIAKYPDWDMLTDGEKTLLKRQEALEIELAEMKEDKAWDRDLSKAKTNFPELSEKEKEFKEYCYKYPKGVDVETLARAFLFESKKPIQEPRKGLEKPTAGPIQPAGGEMTAEDIQRIRETDEKLYVQLLRSGKIKAKAVL